ncbi:MAG: tripartite tricarboxylate transporter substrate binding protein [Reyranella sp.]|uniref:Bug family tripartite tricarboxylate transporter substrate binding protein n=1 Tax=Reyranella sp. TaxID=1929291 RepID=UPI001AC94CBF|nr:tripartite tricarboxylate transporter substrate binding protein [Reyranella sp.]MBN9087240.1 tripartite tricarboxylate transporter substrate binding protein [Reyranella sp.]
MVKLGRRAALAGTVSQMAGAAAAQANYPDRPIRLVVPAGAGGPTDVVARILQPHLSQILGQTVVVENKAGASGNIGSAMVAQAAPDGYTLLMAPSTNALTPALYGKTLGYDVVNGVTGISYVASVPLIVVVPTDGAKTLRELIATMKKEPGKYSYASSGNGGMIHLSGFLFLEKAGVEALHVPYRGSAPGMIDTIAGRHAFQVDTIGSSKGFIDAGKLRVLAVMADKRLPQLPDVPTVEEAVGFKLSINTWYVAQAPAAVPRPIIVKLNAVFNEALRNPEVVKRMAELAIEPIQSTPEEAKTYFDGQMAFWDPIVKASGAKPE